MAQREIKAQGSKEIQDFKTEDFKTEDFKTEDFKTKDFDCNPEFPESCTSKFKTGPRISYMTGLEVPTPAPPSNREGQGWVLKALR